MNFNGHRSWWLLNPLVLPINANPQGKLPNEVSCQNQDHVLQSWFFVKEVLSNTSSRGSFSNNVWYIVLGTTGLAFVEFGVPIHRRLHIAMEKCFSGVYDGVLLSRISITVNSLPKSFVIGFFFDIPTFSIDCIRLHESRVVHASMMPMAWTLHTTVLEIHDRVAWLVSCSLAFC